MKSFIYPVVVFLFSVFCIHKASAQTHSYHYADNNPYNLNNFTVGVYGGLDFSFPDLVAGVQANYMLSRISLEAKFAKGFVGTILGDSNASHGLKAQGLTEITAAFHIVDKVHKETYKYVMGVSQGYNTTTTTYLPVPVYVRKIFGIRTGLMNFNQSAEVFVSAPAGQGYYNYYNIGTTSIYGGLLLKKVKDFKVGVEGFSKERGLRKVREFYLDFLLSPSSRITEGLVRSDSKSEIKIRKTGFRLGIQWRGNRVFGGNFRLETGLMPGYIIPKSNVYTLMTFGFNISGRIGKKGDKIYEPGK